MQVPVPDISRIWFLCAIFPVLTASTKTGFKIWVPFGTYTCNDIVVPTQGQAWQSGDIWVHWVWAALTTLVLLLARRGGNRLGVYACIADFAYTQQLLIIWTWESHVQISDMWHNSARASQAHHHWSMHTSKCLCLVQACTTANLLHLALCL